MVNVGGRSKGCSTCRKRRVKCDETRPICNRCKFQNLPCDGPRDITFVQGTIVKSRRSLPKPKVTSLKVIKPEDVHDVVTHIPSFTLQGDPIERYMCYGRRYFKPGAPLDVLSEKIQLHNLNMLVKGEARGQIFDQAMLSFATVVFGFEHKQSCIMQQGYGVHSSTLQTLSTILRKPNCAGRDDVLLAVVALTMLESIVPTSPQSYLQHIIGLNNLLALRDPEEHASPWSMLIYRSIRHFMLFGALRASKPSVFARPQWKKVFRTGCGKDELLEQDVWDILADCTVLYAECGVVSHQVDSVTEWSSIRTRALTLLSALSTWRRRWEGTQRNDIISSVDQPVQTPESMGASPPGARISIDAATKLILYNSTLLHMLQILRTIPTANEAVPVCPEADEFTLVAIEDVVRCDEMAREIKAATEICHNVSYLSAGKPLLTLNVSPVAQWGISIAWETLKNQGSAEASWLGDLIRSKRQNVLAKGLFDD